MTPPEPRPRRRPVDVGALYDSLEAPAAAAQKVRVNRFGTRFVLVPPGSFVRGTPGAAARRNETPAHDVVLSHGFYLAETCVTGREWLAVNPKSPPVAGDIPVTGISWDDAVAFCARLGRLDNATYRLPTEAEWEYACRAGTTTAYSTGDELPPEVASFRGQFALDSPPAVRAFPANSFGLYAMHGGVWEWCADWYAERYPAQQVRDPVGPLEGRYKVVRGGSWGVAAGCCRSAYRNALEPQQSDAQTGFRFVLVPGAD